MLRRIERRPSGKGFTSTSGTLRADKHHSSKLQKAWNKYGEDSFAISTLEVVPDKDALLAREQHWIDRLKAASRRGYNICPNAKSVLGITRSIETRAKMSAAQRGRVCKPFSEEHKRAISEGQKGRVFSPESRAKISKALTDRPKSAEHKHKLAQASTGKPVSAEVRAKVSAAQTGRVKSEQERANIVASHQTRTYDWMKTPEHREALRLRAMNRKPTPEELARRSASMKRTLAAKRADARQSSLL